MMKTYFAIPLFVLSFGIAQPKESDAAWQVAKAENNFSSASVKQGIKPAFLEFLSDDCVMFNPHPVNGKDLYRNRSGSTAHLSWYPSFVEVAASGEMGISTGPWEYRKTMNDTSVAYGHFFSVWTKQSDGKWKVALDIGVNYPKEKKRTEPEHIQMLPLSSKKQLSNDAKRIEVQEAERNFIQSVKNSGALKSYSQFAAENIRIYRNGNFPSRQKDEALGIVKDQKKQTGFFPLATHAASSGDLGYTYGFSVDAKNDSSSYVRVWRKEKEWKIAVDILETFGTKE